MSRIICRIQPGNAETKKMAREHSALRVLVRTQADLEYMIGYRHQLRSFLHLVSRDAVFPTFDECLWTRSANTLHVHALTTAVTVQLSKTVVGLCKFRTADISISHRNYTGHVIALHLKHMQEEWIPKGFIPCGSAHMSRSLKRMYMWRRRTDL